MLKFKFDIIGITETKIKKNIDPIFDISLDGYIPYHTPTEGDKGGVMLYLKNIIADVGMILSPYFIKQMN